jgi:probable F420-dependent oxidoreductase
VKFGFVMFPTQDAIAPGELGALVEDRGFESLFLPDHTHVPAVTPEQDDVAGLAPEYRKGMDPLVALGAVAQATTTLQLGTAILLVPQRDPIVTAKQVASVDVLSGGRMNLGVGPGWIKQELRNHGTNPDDRWQVLRERVEAMRRIWTDDVASYRGEFVDFEHVTSWPKPLRQPPVLVAGNGPRVTERVMAYGDEWIPMAGPGVLPRIAEFKKTCRKPVTLFGGELRDVAAYAEAGVDRVLFWVRPVDTARMTRTVDRIALRLGDRLR